METCGTSLTQVGSPGSDDKARENVLLAFSVELIFGVLSTRSLSEFSSRRWKVRSRIKAQVDPAREKIPKG